MTVEEPSYYSIYCLTQTSEEILKGGISFDDTVLALCVNQKFSIYLTKAPTSPITQPLVDIRLHNAVVSIYGKRKPRLKVCRECWKRLFVIKAHTTSGVWVEIAVTLKTLDILQGQQIIPDFKYRTRVDLGEVKFDGFSVPIKLAKVLEGRVKICYHKKHFKKNSH